jgi:hypothetical protein
VERGELIRRLVLIAIADDYENVDQVILRDVSRRGARLGVTLERSDIVTALGELVQQGLAKAYRLTESSSPLAGMPPLDVVEEYFETYFYITEKGKKLLPSYGREAPFSDVII